MNITIYIALIIILLLIIVFISLKYYLIRTHTTYITVNDNTPILDECLFHHNYELQYCNYIAGGKKYIITELFNNEINASKENNQQMMIFNAENFDLPPNGKLKFRYICDSCNGVNRIFLDDNDNLVDSKGNIINDDGNIQNYITNSSSGNSSGGNSSGGNSSGGNSSGGNSSGGNSSGGNSSGGNSSGGKNNFIGANQIQNEYNLMTKNYVANRANYNKKIYRDSPNPFIPVHSSSTQNSAYWNGANNSYEEQLHNMLNPANRYADLLSMEKRINSSIDYNNIDNTLNSIEALENSISRDFANDSPMSYVSNIFNRKYPKMSNTSVLANIDPEYIHGGLRGDAKLLN
jgi:hypothetical protein